MGQTIFTGERPEKFDSRNTRFIVYDKNTGEIKVQMIHPFKEGQTFDAPPHNPDVDDWIKMEMDEAPTATEVSEYVWGFIVDLDEHKVRKRTDSEHEWVAKTYYKRLATHPRGIRKPNDPISHLPHLFTEDEVALLDDRAKSPSDLVTAMRKEHREKFAALEKKVNDLDATIQTMLGR